MVELYFDSKTQYYTCDCGYGWTETGLKVWASCPRCDESTLETKQEFKEAECLQS